MIDISYQKIEFEQLKSYLKTAFTKINSVGRYPKLGKRTVISVDEMLSTANINGYFIYKVFGTRQDGTSNDLLSVRRTIIQMDGAWYGIQTHHTLPPNMICQYLDAGMSVEEMIAFLKL